MSEKTNKDKPNLGSMGLLSPGEMLCRARKEKGLAVEEVILHLGITQRTLNALEKDEYEALPSPLYVKGYIRRYCSILNISDTEVLADFDVKVKELGLVNKEPSIRFERNSSRKKMNWKLIISILLVFLLATLIIWFFLSKTLNTEIKELSSEPLESTLPAPLMDAGVSSSIETDYKGIDTPVIGAKDTGIIAQSAVPLSATETHNTEANFVEIELQKRKQTISKPSILLSKGSQILGINVTKQSWVQILDAKGDILLADLKPSGYQSEVKGTAPFNVTLGYAPGVELTLNGQRVEIPAVGNNNTAKLKVGDKEEG